MKENPEFLIRNLEKKDFSDLTRFFKENDIPEITVFFDPFPLTEESAYHLTHLDRKNRYYVLSGEGKIQGLAMLRWWEGYKDPTGGIIIGRTFWGKGLGRRMYTHIFEQAKKLGCKGIVASAHLTNARSISFHNSFAFREIGRKGIIENGKRIDKLLLRKDLD